MPGFVVVERIRPADACIPGLVPAQDARCAAEGKSARMHGPVGGRVCPRTHAYIAKRRAQGKTDNEIRRQPKRYIVRELYRTLNTRSRLGKLS